MKRCVFSFLLMMLIGTYAAPAQQIEKKIPTLKECLNDFYSPGSSSYGELKEYHLYRGDVKLNTALFSNVEVIDSRFDTCVIGISKEPLNDYSLMFASSAEIKAEVTAAARSMTGSAIKQPGTILINIRKFYLSENSGPVGNGDFGILASDAGKAKFIFQAGCYLKQDTAYKLMFTIDTIVRVKSHTKTTRKLMDTVQGTVSAFIQQAASFDAATCAPNMFTAYDIQHISDAEKSTIPVYTVEQPARGIYNSYEDFKSNRPSREKFIAEYRKGFSRPFIYELTDDNKKGKEISRTDYYIICDEGKLFVSAVYGLYPLEKRNNDFYFSIGKGDRAEMPRSSGPPVMFDVLGSMAFHANSLKYMEFKIDHTTGKFLPVRKTDTK